MWKSHIFLSKPRTSELLWGLPKSPTNQIHFSILWAISVLQMWFYSLLHINTLIPSLSLIGVCEQLRDPIFSPLCIAHTYHRTWPLEQPKISCRTVTEMDCFRYHYLFHQHSNILHSLRCMYFVASVCQLFATPWTIARQGLLSMGFFRQEYQRGLPCPPPGDLLDPGIEPRSPLSPAWQLDSLPLSHWGRPQSFLIKNKSEKWSHSVMSDSLQPCRL